LKHRSKSQKRNPLVIQQTVVEQPIVIVQNQNLGAISQLAQIAESEFAALVQSQAALTTQLEEVKNNIRVNHFKARFSQVVSPTTLSHVYLRLLVLTIPLKNTVVVTVTNVIDARDPANVNKRYLINQLLADNGVPDQQVVVMVTQAQEMTIGASPTLDIAGILGGVASASAVSSPTGSPIVAAFDPNAPFGQLNGSMILPYNTSAPANALVFEDPANIIFANSNSGQFVQSVSSFQQDCSAFGAQTTTFINLGTIQLFGSFQAAAAAQLAGLNLGTAVPIIPSTVLLNNPSLALAAQAALASQSAALAAQHAAQSSAAAAAAATDTATASAAAASTAAPAMA